MHLKALTVHVYGLKVAMVRAPAAMMTRRASALARACCDMEATAHLPTTDVQLRVYDEAYAVTKCKN